MRCWASTKGASMSKYRFTDEMAEITGLGGSYEQAARFMVAAGLEWLDEHPDYKPRLQEVRSVEDARGLGDLLGVMDKAAGPRGGATGAMMSAAVSHVRYALQLGWDVYAVEARKQRQRQVDSRPERERIREEFNHALSGLIAAVRTGTAAEESFYRGQLSGLLLRLLEHVQQ